MDEEKEKRAVEKKSLQEAAKSFDELLSPVAEIPDEILSTKEGSVIMKTLFKDRCVENRELKINNYSFGDKIKELEKMLVKYEERLSWKQLMSIISSVLLGISMILIQMGSKTLTGISIALIILAIIMNLWKTNFKKKGGSEEI